MIDESIKEIIQKQKGKPYVEARLQTDLDRLKFIVEFVQADLTAMRPGDKLNLCDDLDLFGRAVRFSADQPFNFQPGWATLTGPPISARDIPNDLWNLQAEFREILKSMTAPMSDPKHYHPLSDMPRVSFETALDQDKRLKVFMIGEYVEILRYRLLQLLWSSTDVDRLRSCPECDRIFVKSKRQEYCSQRCTNRAYMRRYRATKGDEISEANHKQYERRTRAKIGQAVKIGRRPRKRQ